MDGFYDIKIYSFIFVFLGIGISCGDQMFSIYDGCRHLIRDQQLLREYGYHNSDFVNISEPELNLYPLGLPLLRDNKLDPPVMAPGSGTIYIVKNGTVHRVLSWDWFLGQGYSGYCNIMDQREIDELPRGMDLPGRWCSVFDKAPASSSAVAKECVATSFARTATDLARNIGTLLNDSKTPPHILEDFFEPSIVNVGNYNHYSRVMGKLRKSQCVTVVVLGGSTSVGSAWFDWKMKGHWDQPWGPADAYPAVLGELLNVRYPNCRRGDSGNASTHEIINEGVGGWSSANWANVLAEARWSPDHPVHRADLVIVETAVNDINELFESDLSGDNYENDLISISNEIVGKDDF